MRARPVIFLMGPTAGGKTSLAIELAAHIPAEIVSVDSAMVYRGMDIGTAKPAREIMEKVPHHLIDICDPTEAYSAGKFRRDAITAINKIRENNRVPLLVGGTGLYFRSLEQGLSDLPATDPEVRARLSKLLLERGSGALHEELNRVDPASARRIHPNDSQRIQRALEVYEMTKTPLSGVFAEGRLDPLPYELIKLALAPSDRSIAHERVKRRFIRMLDSGLVDEARGFFNREDMHSGLTSMRMVGYRQVWRYLDGQITYPEMQDQAVAATRQLVKRQLTWLRAEKNVAWFDSLNPEALREILKFLDNDPAFSADL